MKRAVVRMRQGGVLLVAGGLLLGTPSSAAAGGYDLPTTYPARHVGMGGTAVGFVSNPSAVVHNPAGLAAVPRAALLAGPSLMLGRTRGAPEADVQAESERAVAPLFFVGGAFRITEWLAAGLAVAPIAAAGASYEYDGGSGPTEDRTSAMFLEVSPALAVELPHRVRIGLGYRISIARMHRHKESQGASGPTFDIRPRGVDAAGFRAGLQWEASSSTEDRPLEERRNLRIGVSYRHRVAVDIAAARGVALGQPIAQVESRLVLPSRLVFGIRGDLGRVGAAVDLEYGFHSQNETTVLRAELNGSPIEVPNPFRWRNAATLRLGLEGRLLEGGPLMLRGGYVFDGRTVNAAYPTPFGPPAAPTHTLTAGGGWDFGPVQVHCAYAFRWGETTILQDDLDGRGPCPLCGHAGIYGVRMHGLFADVSYDLR
ncbi:MAG: OmpP1/FadL family transporter [Myxococcota bacterium]